ncbi:MAG: hypothetical protein E2O43_03930 [Nitrospina sp.]|nr:MAG: hypothetical protein E2O43_03930 [Nitrospina sp.]
MTVEPDAQSTESLSLPPETPVVLMLLGASNLARGCFALGWHLKRCLHPRRVEVMIAAGPGRGYHMPGGLLHVVYPPIRSSPIFEAAMEKSQSGARVVALVTDIGNDILYGVPEEDLIETLQQIFTRLQSMRAEIFYTTIPQIFETGVHPALFHVLRTVLFPRSRVSYDQTQRAVGRINRFLKDAAKDPLRLVPDMDRFTGMDEIHYSVFRASHAWMYMAERMLGPFGISVPRAITFPKMLRSYGQGLRKLVWTDFTGLKKNQPNYY